MKHPYLAMKLPEVLKTVTLSDLLHMVVMWGKRENIVCCPELWRKGRINIIKWLVGKRPNNVKKQAL